MEKQDLMQLLRGNTYPGRGIAIGRSDDGRSAVIVYFIMGRSANSRNRVFTPWHDGIVTEAADPAKLEDPSLIIYAPVRVEGRSTIVTNGNQTDTICAQLNEGASFYDALHAREFEPDKPNYTPRISGLVTFENGGFSYQLSILKRGAGCERFTFRYEAPQPGHMHLIHTYQPGVSPLAPFAGEPTPVSIDLAPRALAEALWNALDPLSKVALFVRAIDPKTQAYEDHIKNLLEA